MDERKILLPQAGREVLAGRGETVLEAAMRSGVEYPHGCRSGRCGTCKSRLVSGEIEMLQHSRFALSQDEHAAGLVLACRALALTDATLTWLDDGEEHPGHPVRRLTGQVVEKANLTHDIKMLRLRVSGDVLAFSPGQYARLSVAGMPARDYSMANQPGDHILEFHVRRVKQGTVSKSIHEALQPGDHVKIEGPFGSSYLCGNHDGPVLAVAGGSGLAPMLSIVGSALSSGMRQPIHLYVGARTARDLYALETLAKWQSHHGNLRVAPVLSEEAHDHFQTGIVAAAVQYDHADMDGWKAYVAGPPPMVDAVREVTASAGLPEIDFHADSFFTPEETVRRPSDIHTSNTIKGALGRNKLRPGPSSSTG